MLGRDYFSRVIYGIQTSERVAFIVAGLSTLIGISSVRSPGYYGGWADNLLMRLTDLVLTLPGLAVLLTLSAFLGQRRAEYRVAVILALLFWTTLARIVRGSFLSLREKEYVEAAGRPGRRRRIIFRHILPNAIGPIIVNATLIVGAGDPRRGGALVPRLRHPAADARARQADRPTVRTRRPSAGGSSPSQA